jgi:multicomponent Na+:H+ antiporter subunit D
MMAGVALLAGKGLAGAAEMVLSHALLKGGLFLACGIVLQRLRAITELHLRGRGRELRALGVLFALGAVGLIGIPYVGTFGGHSLIDDAARAAGHSAVGPIAMVCAGVCSGAILRAGARVFLGWGPAEDPLLSREPEEKPEERGAAYAPMIAVTAVMIVLGLAVSVVPGLEGRIEHGAERFRDGTAYAAQVLHGHRAPGTPHVAASIPAASGESIAYGIGAAAIALATAWFGLYRRRLPARVRSAGRAALGQPVAVLRAAHSGLVGDYLTWLAVGTATIGAIWVLALR